jgi:hypothetical protein
MAKKERFGGTRHSMRIPSESPFFVNFSMKNTSDIKPGNLLEMYTSGEATKFVNENREMKDVLSLLNVRVSQGVQKVLTVAEGEINGASSDQFEPIPLNDKWLTKLKATPFGQSNLQIGNLYFKRTEIGLIHTDNNFAPIPGEKITRYLQQLQNLHKEKTGEELTSSF